MTLIIRIHTFSFVTPLPSGSFDFVTLTRHFAQDDKYADGCERCGVPRCARDDRPARCAACSVIPRSRERADEESHTFRSTAVGSPVQGELSRPAKQGETEGLSASSKRALDCTTPPSVAPCGRACHLPLHRGGVGAAKRTRKKRRKSPLLYSHPSRLMHVRLKLLYRPCGRAGGADGRGENPRVADTRRARSRRSRFRLRGRGRGGGRG